MNTVLKLFLSMSFSGGLLILVLLLGKRLLKDQISRQWQYYIWLIVIFRLLIPFGPETTLLGKPYQAVDRAVTQALLLSPRQPAPDASEDNPAPAAGTAPDREKEDSPAEDLTAAPPLQEIGELLIRYAWLIWLTAALALLIRKITIYQGFVRYIQAGSTPVSDLTLLDRLSAAAELSGVKGPVELCVHPLVSSPLLIGFVHPFIILPRTDIPEQDFQFIILHELTHYRRRDMFYKWLVQLTLCLHWFNPLVHLMSREIAKACEFACDEAVLTKMGSGSAQDYGKTLLDAMAAVGRYRENPGAVTLSENKQLLKERLYAIMNYKKKSTAIRLLTGVLTLCVLFGAAFIGVYPVTAAVNYTAGHPQTRTASDKAPAQKETGIDSSQYAQMAEEAYKAGSLPLFQMAFCNLDAEAQSKWLDQIFTDRQLTFFGAAVNMLDEDCAQIRHLAETTYQNGDIAYFSTLTMHMSQESLETWLDRALEDENWVFQSVLFHALDREDEFDKREEQQEKEWAAAQEAEYRAIGVTMDGKDYYYQGQLVNIFLDIRPNKSFYTLNLNPKGTVNIKIIRSENNEITGAAYMTEAEVTELLREEEA